MEDLLEPRERANQIGRADLEASLRSYMSEGVLSHGWIIQGPKGAGKATLAYRIARGLLDPEALSAESTFDVSTESKTFRQIAGKAHPDMFVAERLWDEKKSKYQSEITIETIRKLTLFLNRTASGGGYRVAIVDTADDMNRNAANALLKVLEEPPAKTILLMLSAAPGRLLATIRSRCRRVELRPLEEDTITGLLQSEAAASAESAHKIAQFSRGRPGYALTLAMGEGSEAIALAGKFLTAARERKDVSRIAAGLSGKAGDARWEIFREVVLDELSEAARTAGAGGTAKEPLSGAGPAHLLEAWERLSALAGRGEALNLDRTQLIMAMAYDLRDVLAA